MAWSYTHHRNPSRIFFFFFFSRKETLLTLLNEYTKIFTNLFLLFLAEIPYGKDHYQTFLHLTVVKILVQLTLLISKTRFWVWVLDWSVRHILFFFKMCLTHTHTHCVCVCTRVREAHFVLRKNHWSISLSLYQQWVLPRNHCAFGPIKMGSIICGDPFFQM